MEAEIRGILTEAVSEPEDLTGLAQDLLARFGTALSRHSLLPASRDFRIVTSVGIKDSRRTAVSRRGSSVVPLTAGWSAAAASLGTGALTHPVLAP